MPAVLPGATGRLVDIGGRRLYTRISGDPTRDPVVVFESGLAGPLEVWTHLDRHLAGEVATIAYERAGTCRSDPGPRRRGLDRLAGDLAALLDGLGVRRPVVVVGHAFGGLVAQSFAAEHPARVAGLVLLGSMHPEELKFSAQQRRGMAWLEQSLQVSMLRALVRRGTGRPADPATDVAAAARSRVEGHPGTWRAALAELRAWKRTDPRTLRLRPLPDHVPVSVVVSGDSLRSDLGHRRLQEELLRLSGTSWTTAARDSSHAALILDERVCPAVADEVRAVLGKAGLRRGETDET